MGAPADAVTEALLAPLSARGVDLEGVEVTRAGRRHTVRVVVDRDGGIDLDAIADISQLVSDVLDGPALAAVVPGPFVLEVTSPGVDRPLTEHRHWRRAIGRLVRAERKDGSGVRGRVTAIDDADRITIETPDGATELQLNDVARATVQVEFV